MTNANILAIICQWINGLGYKAIQSPSNGPAPAGRHIAVALGNNRQEGRIMVPGPVNAGQAKYKSLMIVSNVQLYEVEGDGQWLSDIRARLQTGEIDNFVESHTTPQAGKDVGFSVWEVGEIIDNGFQDGPFYIRQKTMAFDIQHYDHIVHSTGRMESVSGKISNKPFYVEVTHNG